MLGLLIELLINWCILFVYNRQGLSVLGLMPNWRRLRLLITFLVFASLCAASAYLMRLHFGKEVWEINPALSLGQVWKGLAWNFRSVWFEELIFRGALLYILIDRLGMHRGVLLSAVAFGIYHWFSYGVFGNLSQMIPVFLLTGLAGILYGYGYAKTKTLWVPFALHFGWNFTNNFIFSSGQIGAGILVMTAQPEVQVSRFVYYLIALNPMVMYLAGGLVLLWRLRKGDI
jgi:uncharacterized protein